jgi:hemerythrin-like domain-containing protein
MIRQRLPNSADKGRFNGAHLPRAACLDLFVMRHSSLISLSHDHHHGLALALRCRKQALGQIKPTGRAGLQERAAEVLRFYSSNLMAHFRAEEEVLFPLLLSAAAESAPLVAKLTREHREIRDVIGQLKTETGLGKSIFDLGDLLERHIRLEERELFPLFEQRLAPAEAENAGEEIKRVLRGNTTVDR